MKKVWPLCSWTSSWRQQIPDWDELDTFPPQCVKDFLQFYDFPAPLLCFTCLWTGKRQLESRWCWWWFTTNLFTCFGPVNNQSCWWYELQTDLFACLWTRDKQRIMMMTYGFFSDEVDDGSISLNLRGSGDLQSTTLIMSSLVICFAITTTRILSSLSFSLDCSVQGEHTHFWREREDGQFDSEAGKTWPGWFVKKFQSKIDFVDLANIWKITFQADIIMGIHLRKRLFFLSKQAQCFQIPGTDRLFFMK